jgi:hypothetical protein
LDTDGPVLLVEVVFEAGRPIVDSFTPFSTFVDALLLMAVD